MSYIDFSQSWCLKVSLVVLGHSERCSRKVPSRPPQLGNLWCRIYQFYFWCRVSKQPSQLYPHLSKASTLFNWFFFPIREGYHLSEAASWKSSWKQNQAKNNLAKHADTITTVILNINQTDNQNSPAAFPTPTLKTILGKINKQKEKQRWLEIKEKPAKQIL